jgi:glycosyltransferase involved in cell wall biosynthesis
MANIPTPHEVKKTVMNIALIVDPYGEEKPGGLGRAILFMAKGIVRGGHAYTVYLKNSPQKETPFKDYAKVTALGVRRLWLSAGKNLEKGEDLYIFFTPIIPLLFFPKKSIVVVHDFAYIELPPRSLKEKLSRKILRFLHGASLHKATKIVAVSNTAKQNIIKFFNIAPEKITVIYNGFIPLGDTSTPLEVPEKFFLFAGVLKPRKNVFGVIHAFAEFAQTNEEYELVIAGKVGGAYAEEAKRLAEDLGVSSRVRFVGYVTDAELRHLYTKATALVFPSFVEGFGMPILEAMDAGLPVITSNTGALAEVAGDDALLVNPHNSSDIAKAMQRLAEDGLLRDMYREKGKKRASEFSWEKNAKEFSALIDKV